MRGEKGEETRHIGDDESNTVGNDVSNDQKTVRTFLKMIADASLLDTDLMSDIVRFCASSAMIVLNALKEKEGKIKEEGWLVDASKMPCEQQEFLQILPEHLLDDIMTLLLFVAKTNSAKLKDATMDPVLGLIVYLLRRAMAW